MNEGRAVGGPLLSDLLKLPIQGLQTGMILPDRSVFIQVFTDRLSECDKSGIDPGTDQFVHRFFFILEKIRQQLFGRLKVVSQIQKMGPFQQGSRLIQTIHHVGNRGKERQGRNSIPFHRPEDVRYIPLPNRELLFFRRKRKGRKERPALFAEPKRGDHRLDFGELQIFKTLPSHTPLLARSMLRSVHSWKGTPG